MVLNKLKLAIFISGRGSNMHSIMKACEDDSYPAEISLVLSNKEDAEGLKIAHDAGIPTEFVDHKAYDTREAFEDEMQNRLENYDIDLIVLAGFMRILTANFVEKWPDQMINIHPSLLPDYKGLNTHERAINDGKKEAGCTVHFVTADLDSGPTIAQRRVPILDSDTPETLAQRVLVQEHDIYPEAIELIAKSKLKNQQNIENYFIIILVRQLEEPQMANHKPVEVDAKQLQDAKDLWTKFTVGTKYAVVATAATLVLIMLLIVDFS